MMVHSWRRMALGLALALGLSTGAVAAEQRVPLDTATATQLSALDAVSPALAERIVALREARGGFTSVEALRIIPGISEAALSSLRMGTSIRVALSLDPSETYSSPDQVLEHFEGEPDVRTVQLWAEEYAKVQPHLVQKWLSASKAFGALPRLDAEYRQWDRWTNDFRRYDENGNPPTSNTGTFVDVQTDADVQYTRIFEVGATWYLYDLVMSPEQIRVIGEAQDIAKLREKILTEITRLYFERRRLQVDVLLNPKSDLLGQVKDELRLRELAANLDALTGGRFSENLPRG